MAGDDVATAFGAVQRAPFLPEGARDQAADDRPVAIGEGQTNSQPSTVAAMLRLLDVRPGQRVLDVGCGTGWTTALLSAMVGSDGEVHGVERIASLADRARELVASPSRPYVAVHRADAQTLGLPRHAPFDRILVSAGARRLPEPLVEQLVVGGVMVVPVASTMLRVVKHDDHLETSEAGSYRFVPLVVPGD